MRILVVEDEKDLNDLIVKRLKDEKYSVDSCYDGLDAYYYITSTDYDVVILDMMLPKMNGFEVIKKVRDERNETYIIALTAMDSTEDIVNGLNSGADDYMVKPFSFNELIARIYAVTRRKNQNKTNVYKVADLEIDCNKKTVMRAGKIIELSGREYSILLYLVKNKGSVLSREQIEQNVWNYDYEGSSNMIDVYIRYLRKKMDTGYDKKLIHTKRNLGYIIKDE